MLRIFVAPHLHVSAHALTRHVSRFLFALFRGRRLASADFWRSRCSSAWCAAVGGLRLFRRGSTGVIHPRPPQGCGPWFFQPSRPWRLVAPFSSAAVFFSCVLVGLSSWLRLCANTSFQGTLRDEAAQRP